jgi:hypothetical protein
VKKLRMNLDSLVVESFATDGGTGARRGTVQGHLMDSNQCPEGTGGTGSTDVTGCGSCWATQCDTCYGTCQGATCAFTSCGC